VTADLKSSSNGREREIFLAAVEKRTPAERAAFIESACGKDQTLRARIEALLREEESMGDFLETPALQDTPVFASGRDASNFTALVSEQPGDRIDRYKLLQKIGEGGCGIVYMAEQEEPVRRRV
jgi:hypothetical protein